MEDQSVLDRITALVHEEQQLREQAATGSKPQRLSAVEEQLDQCWDLLRQRRAREEFGQNPDDTSARSTQSVESYLQ